MTPLEILAVVSPIIAVGAVVWNARGDRAKIDLTQQALDGKVAAVGVSVERLEKTVDTLQTSIVAVGQIPVLSNRIDELERVARDGHGEQLARHSERIGELRVTVERISANPSRARLPSFHDPKD